MAHFDPKLFESKTHDEMIRLFFRARYAEDAFFGNADIEKWLEEQRTTDSPSEKWFSHRWLPRLGGKLSDVEKINILTSCATPTAIDKAFMKQSSDEINRGVRRMDEDTFQIIFNGFTKKAYSCFVMWHGVIVIFQKGKKQAIRFYLPRPEKNRTDILDVLDQHVFEVLLDEWKSRGPKAENARTELCRYAEKEIARVQSHCVDDFNRAVAMSLDGTKVNPAEWIIVIEETKKRRFRLFHSFSFQENKILLSNDRKRESLKASRHYMNLIGSNGHIQEKDFERLRELIRDCDGQTYVSVSPNACGCYDAREIQRILITSERFCPKPLPDEKVKIQIYSR